MLGEHEVVGSKPAAPIWRTVHRWKEIADQIERLDALAESVADGTRSMLVCAKCGSQHRLTAPYSWGLADTECPERTEHHDGVPYAVVGGSDGVLHATYEIWITEVTARDEVVAGLPERAMFPIITIYSRTIRSTARDRYNTQGFGAVQRARREAFRWLRGDPDPETLEQQLGRDVRHMIDGLRRRPIL